MHGKLIGSVIVVETGGEAMAVQFTVPVRQHGQITVPKAVRDVLGLRDGSTVRFLIGEDGSVELQKSSPGRW
jgi:AbrB family looped-hinge helix DNA binding protein